MSKCGPFGTIGRPFFFPLNTEAFLSSFHFLFFSSSFPFLSPSSCDSFLLLFKTERRRAILPGEKTSSSSLQIPTLGGAGWEVINLDEEEGEEHSSSSSASSVKNNGNKKKIKSRRKMTSWRERNRRMKLIRFLILAILLLLFWRYYSSSSSSSSSNDLTSLSSSLLLQDKRIEPFFFRASSSSSSSSTETEIVLLTHLTVDRLQSLVEMVKAWQHPLSVSILIRNNEDIETLMKVRSESEILKQFADIHLYIQLEQGPYPVNHLRNLALSNSQKGGYVLMLDADFVPSPGLHDHLQRLILTNDRNAKVAFVIPAFELESPTIEIPSSATTLRELLEKGEARQVHSFKGARAHAATDYQRWKSLGKTRNPDSQSENVGRELWYEVAYEYLWEPYVLVRKGEESQVPRYDERFIGYGNDKVSFVYELAASGYSFRVILDGFIIHKDHEKPKWRSDYGSQMNGNSQRGWKKWVEFVHDIKRRYKGFEVSVPEWLKRDCINRAECPEFWTWI